MQVQGGAGGQHRVSRKSKAEVCFKPPKLFSCYQNSQTGTEPDLYTISKTGNKRHLVYGV